MPIFNHVSTITFDGTATPNPPTANPNAIKGFTEAGFGNGAYLDGSGSLVLGNNGALVLHAPTTVGLYRAVEAVIGPIDTNDNMQRIGVLGLFRNDATNSGPNLELVGARQRGSAIFNHLKFSEPNAVGGVFTTGQYYRLRVEITPGQDGKPVLTAMAKPRDGGTWTKTAEVSITDAAYQPSPTPALPNGQANYEWGVWSEYGAPSVKYQSVSLYEYVPDTVGPIISSVTVQPSGQSVVVAFTEATLPILPATGITGFSLEVQNNAVYTPIALSQVFRHPDTDKIVLVPATQIYDGQNVRLQYAGGNVSDSVGPTPYPMANVSNYAVTNNSDVTPTSSTKGIMVLGTRGWVGAAPLAGNNPGKEVQSLFGFEVPYGAAPGWKLSYLGMDPSLPESPTDPISILGAVAWIYNPGEPRVQVRITFGGSNTTTINQGTFVETDPTNISLTPGAKVKIATWYRCPNMIPYTFFCHIGSGGTRSDDLFDGVKFGDAGTLVESTLFGGFDHLDFDGGPTNAGVPGSNRLYRPMCMVGRPSTAFTGTEIVLLWAGDSINQGEVDGGEAFAGDPYATRVFHGRFVKDKYPSINFGKSGSGAGNYIGNLGSPILTYLQGDEAQTTNRRKVTHFCSEYGINTLRNQGGYSPNTAGAALVWQERQQTLAAAASRGLKTLHTTLTPMTFYLQTDGESGPEGQAWADFYQSRTEFNEKVRNESNTLPGCIGYFDVTANIETSVNNGIWGDNLSGDGLHPNSGGHQLMADAMSDAVLIANPNPLPPIAPSLSSITVSRDAADGQGRYQFHAVAQPDGASLNGLVWSASAGTIDAQSGLHTPPAAGPSDITVFVTATVGATSVTYSYVVEGIAPPVLTSIVVARDPLFDGTYQFHATAQPDGASLNGLVWSANAGSITQGGLHTPPTAGENDIEVIVTATVGQIAGTYSYTVAGVPAGGGDTGGDTGSDGFTAADRAMLLAVKVKTDLIPTNIDGKSLTQALQIIAAAVAGKLSGAAGNTIVIRGLDGTTTRITATVDADGNRTSVTY